MSSELLSLVPGAMPKSLEASATDSSAGRTQLAQVDGEMLPSELAGQEPTGESFGTVLQSASMAKQTGADKPTDSEAGDSQSVAETAAENAPAQMMAGQVALMWPGLVVGTPEGGTEESQVFGPLLGGQVMEYGQTMVGMRRAAPVVPFVQPGPVVTQQTESAGEVPAQSGTEQSEQSNGLNGTQLAAGETELAEVVSVEHNTSAATAPVQSADVAPVDDATPKAVAVDASSGFEAVAEAVGGEKTITGQDFGDASEHGRRQVQSESRTSTAEVTAQEPGDPSQPLAQVETPAEVTEVEALQVEQEDRLTGTQVETRSESEMPLPDVEPTAVVSSEPVQSDATEGVAQTAESVDDSKLITRIVQAARMSMEQGRQVVRMRLDPPELGTLKLTMQLERGQLSVSVETSSEAAKQVLDAQKHVLVRGLAQCGLGLERLDFSVQEHAAGEQSWTHQDAQNGDVPHQGRPFEQSTAQHDATDGSDESLVELGPQELDMVA